jgi:predicted nucleic acid-binding protein
MYVDTTIFMYAMGAESPWKGACAKILRAGAAEEVALVTSAETLQEILHWYRSIGREKDIRVMFDAVAASVQSILPVSFEDVDEARRLGERVARGAGMGRDAGTGRDAGEPRGPAVSARDLVHAAVARRQGTREILTVDAGFRSIPGVVVIDPVGWKGDS